MSPTRLLSPATVVTIAGHSASPISGTATLDETTTYATADMKFPLIDPAVIEEIDPRDMVRATILTGAVGGTPRSFDLGVRSRRVDHAAKTIDVSCASDEALVQDYALLADDLTPLSLKTSLRSVVNYVLDTILPGTTLETTPANDARVTMLDVDNLVENHSLTADDENWHPWLYGASGSGARVAGSTPDGAYFYRVAFTSTAGGPQAGAFYTIDRGIKEGTTYTATAEARVNFTQDVRLRLEWFDKDDATISASAGATVTAIADTWTPLLIQDMPAPKGATHAVVTIYGALTGSTWTSGKRIDVASLRVGPTASEPLNWRAGVNGWKFLLNLTAAAQLRLFCDETRKWRLVPMEYTVPGTVTATPATARSGTDTIDRDGDLWADGVVARYSWSQPDGTTLEKLDVAGEPGKVQLIEFDRPYPGPGAAQFRLNRLRGQGRVQESVAFADYGATPGMEARQTLPGTFDQVGRLQSVTFGLTDGFMVIGSRGLTDAPPTAYVYGDAGISYDDVPIGMSYDDFDWGAL